MVSAVAGGEAAAAASTPERGAGELGGEDADADSGRRAGEAGVEVTVVEVDWADTEDRPKARMRREAAEAAVRVRNAAGIGANESFRERFSFSRLHK
jgi:hypothetical protein